jgi:hypothetical protein
MSKVKVKRAAPLFPLRSMFVAPMFLEPNVLGSFILKINFPINPKGMDPIR